MAEVNSIVAIMRDVEGAPDYSAPIYVPTGDTLAHYQDFFEAYADVIDDVSGAQVIGGLLTLSLALPGSGIKTAPTALYYNERGANLLMDVDGSTFNESFRIPAILASKLAGNNLNLSDTQVANLISFLVAGDGVVIPKTRAGLDYTGGGISGKKTFRRK